MVSIVMRDREKIKQIKDSLPKTIQKKCRFWATEDHSLTSVSRNIAVHEGTPMVVIFEKNTPEKMTEESLWVLVGNMSGMSRCRIIPMPKSINKLCEKVTAAVKDLYE